MKAPPRITFATPPFRRNLGEAGTTAAVRSPTSTSTSIFLIGTEMARKIRCSVAMALVSSAGPRLQQVESCAWYCGREQRIREAESRIRVVYTLSIKVF